MRSHITLQHPETWQNFDITFDDAGQFQSAEAYHGLLPAGGEHFFEIYQLPEPIRSRVQQLVEIKARPR